MHESRLAPLEAFLLVPMACRDRSVYRIGTSVHLADIPKMPRFSKNVYIIRCHLLAFWGNGKWKWRESRIPDLEERRRQTEAMSPTIWFQSNPRAQVGSQILSLVEVYSRLAEGRAHRA